MKGLMLLLFPAVCKAFFGTDIVILCHDKVTIIFVKYRQR